MQDRTVRIWDSHGKSVAVLRGHTDLVMDVARVVPEDEAEGADETAGVAGGDEE